MAELRKITERPALSNFSRAPAQGGTAFLGLAGIMQEAYRALEPAAMQEAERQGMEQGLAEAQRDIGEPRPIYPLYGQNGQPQARMSSSEWDGQDLASGIVATANALQMSPEVLSTIISYETGGTFDPTQPGPTTQWGQHRGLIQFGEPQAREYGVDWNDPIGSQLGPNGAIANYFRSNGWQPGMSELDAYSIVNAGGPGLYNRSDANNGGAPGTVADKVNNQFGPHRENARRLLSAIGADGADLEARVSSGGLAPVLGEPDVAAPGGSVPAAPPAEPTSIRTADGRIENRRYSPLSGPILQAHNAAADLAYASEVTNRYVTDMVSIANEMAGNPEGVRQRGEAMIDQMVENAHESLRTPLRMQLEQELGQVYRGAMDQMHREVRQRASNSNLALVNRYSDDYSDALLSGDQDQINASRQRLEETLIARTSLPGLAYTPEQAQNVILAAEDAAEQMREARRDQQVAEWGDMLEDITGTAAMGYVHDNEAVLANPAIRAARPEEWQRAVDTVLIRELTPEFLRAPPAEQQAFIDDLRNDPVPSEDAARQVEALDRIRQSNVEALQDDPITWARERRSRNKPPELPDFMGVIEGSVTQDQFVAGFQRRMDYATQMTIDGFTPQPVFFDQAEREALSSLVGEDTEWAVRGAAAVALIRAAGPNAGLVMEQLDADPALVHGASISALGGSPQLAADIVRGMELIDSGTIQMPSNATTIEHLVENDWGTTGINGDDIHNAVPNIPNLRGQLQSAARALYALDARGVLTGDMDEGDTLRRAYQEALGQHTDNFGVVRGGVQEVNGQPALLPPSVSASDLSVALRVAVGVPAVNRTQGGGFTREATEPQPDMWGGSIPYLATQEGREPLSHSDLEDTRLVPITRGEQVVEGRYRMEYTIGNNTYDVTGEDGSVFVFDVNTLLEGLR
jgi:hypothetical protein